MVFIPGFEPMPCSLGWDLCSAGRASHTRVDCCRDCRSSRIEGHVREDQRKKSSKPGRAWIESLLRYRKGGGRVSLQDMGLFSSKAKRARPKECWYRKQDRRHTKMIDGLFQCHFILDICPRLVCKIHCGRPSIGSDSITG